MSSLPARGPDPRLAQVSIRRSTAGDAGAIARLAQLEGVPPPAAGEYLLAEEDGVLRAARALAGGRAIADPFHATADLVAMLELRAARLVSGGGAAPRSGGLRSLGLGRRGQNGLRPAISPARARIALSGSALQRT